MKGSSSVDVNGGFMKVLPIDAMKLGPDSKQY